MTVIKIPLFILIPIMLLLSGCVEQGEVEVISDEGATVFIDGSKKAMIGSNGNVTLTVKAGDRVIRIERTSSDGKRLYTGEENAFIGANTKNTLKIRTSSKLTAKGEEAKRIEEERLAKIRAEEKRWWNIAAQHNRWASFKDPDPSSPTVKDPLTGLEWMRCSLGQTWTGKTCSGTAKEYNWSDAKQQASNTTYAGNSDWRLPTIDELHSIVYCSSGQRQAVKTDSSGYVVKNSSGIQLGGHCEGSYAPPTLAKTLFPKTPSDGYWSESAFVGVIGFISGFGNRFGNSINGNYKYHVRLVRSGQ